MGIYNLNPRRVVWFSPNEPSNKYDIWLSRNAHLDENGEPTTDSNSQRDCDYIFKIYDCGKWNPIVGFNTTAANKINTVASADGYQENHVPLFGNPDNSPDELVDGGTIGDVLYEHMTESDWEHILESGGLGTAITEYSTENPFHLDYAGHQTIGGIWADRFTQPYNDTTAANKTYLAQTKYKYQQTASDYNLYVHARDIMLTIQHYTEDHGDDPGFPNILPPNIGGNITVDPIVLYRSFYNSPTILKGWTDDLNQAQKPRFELAGARTLQNRGKLLMLKSADDPFWSNGPSEYDEASNANALNWVSPDELFDDYHYELELASLGALGGIRAAAHASFPVPHTVECKLGTNLAFALNAQYKKQALHIDVKDVKNALDEWYAENDSTEWDLNLKASYGIVVRKETFTDDDNNQIVSYTHSLSNYGQFTQEGLYCRTKFYNQATPGVQNRDYSYNDTHGLEWVEAQTIVEEGLGISGGEGYLYYDEGVFSLMSAPGGGGGDPYPVLGSSNYTEDGNYVIGVPSGGTGGLTRYLNGLGLWSVPTIDVPTFSGASPGLVPQSTLLTRDKYLKGDGTWGTPTVSAEFDIDMDSQAVSDDNNFTLSDTTLTSSNSLSPINKILLEWYYYEVNCGNKTTEFAFSHTHVSGNAIYIRFNTAAAPVAINTDADIIFSNETMSSSRRQFAANSSYLITIQFGIIKIEKITVDSSQENA